MSFGAESFVETRLSFEAIDACIWSLVIYFILFKKGENQQLLCSIQEELLSPINLRSGVGVVGLVDVKRKPKDLLSEKRLGSSNCRFWRDFFGGIKGRAGNPVGLFCWAFEKMVAFLVCFWRICICHFFFLTSLKRPLLVSPFCRGHGVRR